MDRIGEYRVKRLVGEGGMGKVYEAEERLTQRRVALKVLRPELTRTDEGRRLFLNEMQILAHLEHPHIVRSLASIEHEGQLVMVLEFLDGRTLREELVARGKLPWDEAIEVAARVAEALVVAHRQAPAIVHRDLKPENVMLTRPAADAAGAAGGLKVMDFGIAKMLQAAQATNTQSVGTLQYMSPEQIDAQTIDARSDLYSLGLVFYEALAGQPPFRSASPRELLNLQCSAEPPELPEGARVGLPRGVESLLFKLLEKSPSDRPASAKDVVERLAPFRAAPGGPKRETKARAALEASAPPASARDTREAKAGRSAAKSPSTGTGSSEPPPEGDPEAPIAETQQTGAWGALAAARAGASKRGVPATDTIALVERAGAGPQVSTPIAVLAIALLSIVAGVATYAIRMHTSAPSTAGAVTATTLSGSRELHRDPGNEPHPDPTRDPAR